MLWYHLHGQSSKENAQERVLKSILNEIVELNKNMNPNNKKVG
jgi:hypothetical protein